MSATEGKPSWAAFRLTVESDRESERVGERAAVAVSCFGTGKQGKHSQQTELFIRFLSIKQILLMKIIF